MTMFVCYNYADKFLHLYIETHVSQTFINSNKTLFYYGGTFNFFRGPNMVSNFWGKQSLIFGQTDYSFFVFEESARQTSVSTV